MEFPISKVINVTMLGTPQGVAEFNVNSVALFTDESPAEPFASGYNIYSSPDGVASDFGSSSETYAQAVAIFSQEPNILSAGGYLVVIPLLTLGAATSGTMMTLTPGNLAAFQAVTAGACNVSIDSVVTNLTALNFTTAHSFNDVATTLSTAVSATATVAYDATANGNTGGFLFTSKSTGATSLVTALSSPSSGTDISTATYLNGQGNVRIINGQAASATENLVSAVVRTNSLVYYFGVLSTTAPATADALNFASYMQTQDKLWFLGRNSTADITAVFEPIQSAGLTHTRTMLYQVGAQSARVLAAAYASRLLGTDYSGSDTVCTMNLKTLAGITPDSASATDNIDNLADQYGFDIYVSIAGDSDVVSYGANDYSDQIYGQLWLKLALQVAGYNYLKTTNTKIPQTEQGMTGLKSAYASVCEQGIVNGYMASGLDWTSPTTFGVPADLKRNITDVGYYIYSQPVATQNPVDRAARKAPLVQIAVKEAGAYQHSDVIVQTN